MCQVGATQRGAAEEYDVIVVEFGRRPDQVGQHVVETDMSVRDTEALCPPADLRRRKHCLLALGNTEQRRLPQPGRLQSHRSRCDGAGDIGVSEPTTGSATQRARANAALRF